MGKAVAFIASLGLLASCDRSIIFDCDRKVIVERQLLGAPISSYVEKVSCGATTRDAYWVYLRGATAEPIRVGVVDGAAPRLEWASGRVLMVYTDGGAKVFHVVSTVGEFSIVFSDRP